MSKQEIDREIVIIQKSFDYILDNLLSTENAEVPFPNQQKYQLKKVLQDCKELAYKGFYKKAYEQLLFAIGYLFTHFEIVREKVQKDYESMLRIIDVKTTRIKEIENLIDDGEKGIRPRKEELNNIQEQIDDNLKRLEYIEDIFNFSRERVDEFSDFVEKLDKKGIEPNRIKKVLLKELNTMQNLILSKYESKFENRKEKREKKPNSVVSQVKEDFKQKEESQEENEDDDSDNSEDDIEDDSGLLAKKEEKINERELLRRTSNG